MTRPRSPHPGRLLAAAVTLLALVPTGAAAQPRTACASCHGELELLRQHVETLEDARALLVRDAEVRASAHGAIVCGECHTGKGRFPHGPGGSTRTCASCHEEAEASWAEGVHALDGRGGCADCHGVHDVRTADELAAPEGVRDLRSACASCHFEAPRPELDPHADSVSCADCHEPHRTLPAEDDRASVHVTHQAATCGACHEEVALPWREDVHGTAVPGLAHPGGSPPRGASRAEPPACTACHGSHELSGPATAGFGVTMSERCAECHEEHAESFADSYHGQAVALGSEAVATCFDCHGAHDVYPSSDARSAVGEARLLDTCRSCHPGATDSFVLFQPHADHDDRENYPYVYWSYHLMTALLVGTFGVFGLHTLLWLIRLGAGAMRPREPAPPREVEP